ncbi:MAG: hypothetical protein DIZ80_12875 [endosymbiont of Galathealinum brachiosum]|uniref:Uncharacterized protein n=1 Tax=endosymbiont of Galathealinum brachiosum TaxID=2200906 RepID=A0A370D7U9_9GAMM|nr:MAG: hypothetical protein DIZ80_12875 [endosymbiont of Galathealinum brachiosum]
MNKKFQEILALAQTGKVDGALQKSIKAVKKKPKDINFILLTASLYAQLNDFDKVITYCLKALDLDKNNESALYNIGIAFLKAHDYKNALQYNNKAIALNPKNPKTLTNAGLASWNLGDFDSATNKYIAALKLDANNANTHNNLGLAYKSLKTYDLAIEHFQKAIKLQPSMAEGLYNLGITLIDTGDTSGNEYVDRALLTNPNYPEANNFKGLALFENNQNTLAIEHFTKAIKNKEDYFEAYCNLGNAYMQDRLFHAAEKMYRKAIEYKPDYANALNNLGNALLDQENYSQHYEEAEALYLKAIELSPDIPDAYKNLAVCYQGQGKHDLALKYFNEYDIKIPNDEVCVAGMASIYEHQANHDQGLEIIKPYLDKEEVHTEIVLAYGKLAKHHKLEEHAITLLEALDDEQLITKHKVEKYFALGKLYESSKITDKTFISYKKANDLDEDKHDLDETKKMFNNIKEYFTKEKIQSLKRSENNSDMPIFIVGMPRSGTSLAEQILASHPTVYGAGELENIHNIVQQIAVDLKPADSYPQCLDNMSTKYATEIATQHLTTLQAMSPDAAKIIDKMPHNFLGLGIINLLFPNATVINCLRSSIDVCLSIYFQHFNKHHSYSNSLEMLGKYYNLYADLMEHWKDTLDINLIELKYENVITNPEQEIRALLEKCNLEWNPACLEFHKNKRTVMTPSYDQVRRPIYTSSVEKWRKYETFLPELIDNLGDRAF